MTAEQWQPNNIWNKTYGYRKFIRIMTDTQHTSESDQAIIIHRQIQRQRIRFAFGKQKPIRHGFGTTNRLNSQSKRFTDRSNAFISHLIRASHRLISLPTEKIFQLKI